MNHHEPSLTIMNHHEPSLTIYLLGYHGIANNLDTIILRITSAWKSYNGPLLSTIEAQHQCNVYIESTMNPYLSYIYHIWYHHILSIYMCSFWYILVIFRSHCGLVVSSEALIASKGMANMTTTTSSPAAKISRCHPRWSQWNLINIQWIGLRENLNRKP